MSKRSSLGGLTADFYISIAKWCLHRIDRNIRLTYREAFDSGISGIGNLICMYNCHLSRHNVTPNSSILNAGPIRVRILNEPRMERVKVPAGVARTKVWQHRKGVFGISS